MSDKPVILGCGIDIVEIARIKSAIDRWGRHFLDHIFCPEEIDYAQKHTNPFQHYAARFAAKEAVMKALGGQENIRWKDIKIHNQNMMFNIRLINYH